MRRRNFLFTALALSPVTLFKKIEASYPGNDKGFKVKSGEARFGVHYQMKGITQNMLDLKVSGKDTDNNLSVFVQTGLSQYGGPPLHIHPYQDEWFFILEGRYKFQVGNEKFEMQTGDTIFLPHNIQHAFIQLTGKGKVLVSFLPAGKMEDFFAVTDSWSTFPSQDEIVKVFAEHEMKIVGPLLNAD